MLDTLKEEYRNSLKSKVKTIRALLIDYRAGHEKAEQNIRHLAHSLHGSGTTYGFPEISEAAKAVEHAAGTELIKKLTELIKVTQDVVVASEVKADNSGPSENTELQKILIIDDASDLSNVLQASINSKADNYQVSIAATAAEGRKYLDETEFSLVLLDLILPDEDGRNVLREIKYGIKAPIPVFVMSAIDRDVVRIECMSLGADKYFNKPLDVVDLVENIDNLLRKSKKRALSLKPLNEGQPEQFQQPEKTTDAKGINLSGKTVLLAEDDDMQAKMVKQRLVQEGLNVEHVVNGMQAMEALQRKSYSLIILDVRMPELDGFEVLKRIRTALKLPDVPIIMLTAMGSEDDIIRGYDLGANDYMLKPFSPVELIARVKSLLKKNTS